MKLVTVQSSAALKTLLSGKVFRSDFNHIIRSKSSTNEQLTSYEHDDAHRIQSYQILMKHYLYESPPIFCCILDKLANFDDTKRSRSMVLLELDVPDHMINYHLFCRWSYIVFYVSNNDWTDFKYDIFKKALDGDGTNIEGLAVQAVIPYIKPEWLERAYSIKRDLLDYYHGNDVLRSSSYDWRKPLYEK